MPNLRYYLRTPTAAPITKALSQYELLQSICSTLSSADIVHLAATCKENQTYITSSKEILTLLRSTAHCDGRGIVAQARVFGYWEGDPAKAPAESQCLGADAKPCTSCGAHTCDNCRFHFTYDPPLRKVEPQFAQEVEDEGIDHLHEFLPDLSIESGKAFDVFWKHFRQTFCDSCEPLLIGFENDFQTCRCDFYEYFVGKRWLCLPCFFVEETKTYSIKQREIVAFKAGTNQAMHRPGYIGVDVCVCGRHVRAKSTECCRRCGGVTGWYRDRKDDILQKIYAQLG